VTRPLDLLLNEQWFSVLDQLGEAVIVIDDRRMLCHVNDAARRLLGYDPGQAVGGRCRHTTQGVDCEHACPLTFALEAGLQRVESFATVYRTASGEAVALDVTVVPLHDEERRFRGAVEILRPTSPKPGFFMSGHSEAAADLRRRALAAARVGGDLAIVGEGPVCRDLARAIHRFSGLPETLFHHWNGSWDGIAPWPPGAVFVDDVDLVPLLEEARPEGWRAMLGVRSIDAVPSGVEVFEQPPLDRHTADLPRMIAT
jgi:PAS domain S-box-containing protein